MSRKASGLAELARRGVAVPVGFHLDQSHYQEAIEPVRRELMSVVDAVEARRVFAKVQLPTRTSRALHDGLKAISTTAHLAVRSSGNVVAKGCAIAEDGSTVKCTGFIGGRLV